jgi:glycosyltransferase involved in cell wall biosynthesis
LLLRVARKAPQLLCLNDRSAQITKGMILAAVTVRNEASRLPYFLDHHRALGVGHFLIVDNGSDDGTTALLRGQPDVSLWYSRDSYKLSRFGLDWVTALQARFAHGHWCLTLDADELFIYPHWPNRSLHDLTAWLDQTGQPSFGALMLDLYPRGPLNQQSYAPASDPMTLLQWFDAGNYRTQVQPRMHNLWVQGGVRERCFFQAAPQHAPTLNKTPLVKWHRRYAYVNSTHALLPRHLNHVYGKPGEPKASGVLLHTKFLPEITTKSAEEKTRQEHFANSLLYNNYYDALTAGPDLWHEGATRDQGWEQLEALGLMSRGAWL